MKKLYPIVSIIGRVNVGKSTLFNRLTKDNQAVMYNLPGVTRDRLYGVVKFNSYYFTLVDTGGCEYYCNKSLNKEIYFQIEAAINEADLILFVTDDRSLNFLDLEIINYLRRIVKPVICVINKVDISELNSVTRFEILYDFVKVGLKQINLISALHGYGIDDLLKKIIVILNVNINIKYSNKVDKLGEDTFIRVALLGQPNVGKSSIINALVGTSRMVVSDIAGTTRDTVDVRINFKDRKYILIDTAGIRRRSRIMQEFEYIIISNSLKVIKRCHIVVIVIDLKIGLSNQDLRLIKLVVDKYRGLIVAFNKIDLFNNFKQAQNEFIRQTNVIKRLVPWASVVFLSVKIHYGLSSLLDSIDNVFVNYNKRIATGVLNHALQNIIARRYPPIINGKRLKIFYVTQIGVQPPRFILFLSDPQLIHFSYYRYLISELRQAVNLALSPLILILRKKST